MALHYTKFKIYSDTLEKIIILKLQQLLYCITKLFDIMLCADFNIDFNSSNPETDMLLNLINSYRLYTLFKNVW